MTDRENPFIYLDNCATTPADPRVVEAMVPYFHDLPGNAASRSHPWGWMAEEAVENARRQIASLIGADPREIVFTSGATESDNLALKGTFERYRRKGSHLITLRSEHKAVLDSCRHLEKMGAEITYLDVDQRGLICLDELAAAIRPDTVLVSVLWANNETGVIQPMEAIGELCADRGVLLMSDATQAVGKIPVNPRQTGVQLMAFSAHKMYGPKGVGALYVSRQQPRVHLTAQMDGGGHEHGMRSGTLNVPGIVGFGQAAAIAAETMADEAKRLAALRDRLEGQLLQRIEESAVNGHRQQRLPHVSNMSFKFVDGEGLMMHLNKQLALASGSACSSASLDPSHVLRAMNLGDDRSHSAIRFSLGRFNTAEEVERAIEWVTEGVSQLREQSPVWEMFKEGIDLDTIEWANVEPA